MQKNDITYYFLDDDSEQEPVVGQLTKQDGLNIHFHQITKDWNKDFSVILDLINKKDVDGLLFDWQLNEKDEGFDSEAIVQQIRRVIVEKNIRDIPIVLCSSADSFEEIFTQKFTGYDLFDLSFPKLDFSKVPIKIAQKLISLGEGYRFITNIKELDLHMILGFESQDFMLRNIPKSFIGHYMSVKKNNIPHEFVNSLLHHFILYDGLLITRQTLATRLGICNISSREEDWERLYKAIHHTKYNGIFSSGWNRWWMNQIESWWKELTKLSLRRTSADKKIEILNGILDTNFSKIPIHPKHQNTTYWINCVQTNIPIDTVDGVLITDQVDSPSWLDKKYLSIEAITNPDTPPKYDIDISFAKKVTLLRQKYDNSNIRIKR